MAGLRHGAYVGYADEPVVWDDLLRVFDAVFGADSRDLATFPATLKNLQVYWIDGAGVEWPVKQLTELEQAYSDQKTSRIVFIGFWDGFSAKFAYLPAAISEPGAQRTPKARFEVDTDPSKVDAMVEAVRHAFPRQRGILFISWAGQSRRVSLSSFNTCSRRGSPPAPSCLCLLPASSPGLTPIGQCWTNTSCLLTRSSRC